MSPDSLNLVLGVLLLFDTKDGTFFSSVTGTAHVITAYQVSGSSRADADGLVMESLIIVFLLWT